jgi:undecaprenyl-diphosphatase
MTDPNLLTAAILGLVEGITEFLPVSSTGHLIVAGSLLDYTGDKAKLFEIVIQAGAILAVCWEYRARLFAVARGLPSDRVAQRFVVNLFVAFLPAAVIGLAFNKVIKAHLFAPLPVASAFIIGALVILWVERRQRSGARIARIQSVNESGWHNRSR